MTEDLLRLPEAQEFLSDYPKGKWNLCIESVFIYGLYSIKRDFPNGLSIPELMQIAGYDKNPTKAKVISPIPARPLSCKKYEEVQTSFKAFARPLNAEENLKKLKTSGSQTFISTNKSFHKTNDFTVERGVEDFSISERIKEPRICSMENAKKIMKSGNDEGIGRFRGKAFRLDADFAPNINVDYLPKTISTDLYRKERNLMMSPKYFS